MANWLRDNLSEHLPWAIRELLIASVVTGVRTPQHAVAYSHFLAKLFEDAERRKLASDLGAPEESWK